MIGTAITSYQFTIEKAITEWLEQKRIRTGSQKTYDAYRDTMQSFRLALWQGNIDLSRAHKREHDSGGVLDTTHPF